MSTMLNTLSLVDMQEIVIRELTGSESSSSATTEDIYVNGTIIPCKTDLDCPLTAICYNNSRISVEVGQCGCDYDYGDVGDLCNQRSSMTYFILGWFSFFIVISTLSFLFALYEIFMIQRTGERLSFLNVKTTTLIACMLTYASFILYAGSGIVILLNPQAAPMSEQTAVTKKRSLAYLRTAGLALYSFFLITSLLNVSILWLEVAIASKKFQRVLSPQVSKNYRYAVATFDVVACIAVAAVSWFNSTYLSYIGVVLIVLVSMLYGYSAYSITMVMNSTSKNAKYETTSTNASSAMKTALKKINKCAAWVMVCSWIWIILLLVVAVKRPNMRKEARPNGQVYYISWLSNIGFMFALMILWGIIFYLRSSSKSKESSRAVRDMESADITPKARKDGLTGQELSVKKDTTSAIGDIHDVEPHSV